MIPPAALEQVEQAFVRVLRRRHPDALFIVRDLGEGESPILPADTNVASEIPARAAGDFDLTDEAGEHVPPLPNVETVPEGRERPASGKPGKAA